MTNEETILFRQGIEDSALCQTHFLSPQRPTVGTVNVSCGEDCSRGVICLRNFAGGFRTVERKYFAFVCVQDLAVLTGWKLQIHGDAM